MISIINEESHFLVINKPAGLFTQAARGIASVETQLTAQLKERDDHQGTPFVGLPHRLDRGTSGVLLLAKNQRALKRFGQQFQTRKVNKFYLALVHGECDFESARWEDYLRKVPDQPLAEVVQENDPGAKHAVMDVRCITKTNHASGKGSSLLLVQLHTGRMHQIRIQAASRGLPLVGDTVYGECRALDSEQAETTEFPSQQSFALHALRIEFRHPQNGVLTCCSADLPQPWDFDQSSLRDAAASLCSVSQADGSDSWHERLAQVHIQ